MGSSEVMDLPHANAIPLKKQQQTQGKRRMKGAEETPLLPGEKDRKIAPTPRPGQDECSAK
ncbi:hypothetical protein HMPREF0201_04529 [Cedecea davisae DSM 4568]|uniref:Uncharacterized protein n=1 Tax=Cedecea davisae DSM 4568 TaxID=566551 RepID=S3IKJ4_9ENTR|nr:hypothetical protein HMPREF0201_04529 [Cedecea davisae DSM 4568]